jgi:hypothetical protein
MGRRKNSESWATAAVRFLLLTGSLAGFLGVLVTGAAGLSSSDYGWYISGGAIAGFLLFHLRHYGEATFADFGRVFASLARFFLWAKMIANSAARAIGWLSPLPHRSHTQSLRGVTRTSIESPIDTNFLRYLPSRAPLSVVTIASAATLSIVVLFLMSLNWFAEPKQQPNSERLTKFVPFEQRFILPGVCPACGGPIKLEHDVILDRGAAKLLDDHREWLYKN